jgi:hypothetical protein
VRVVDQLTQVRHSLRFKGCGHSTHDRRAACSREDRLTLCIRRLARLLRNLYASGRVRPG